MSRIDRLDPRTKLHVSCALIALLATALAWWLLAQSGHAHALASQALRQGASAAPGLRAHYSHVLLIGWVGVGAVALCAALLGRWLSNELTRPLRDAATVAARVACGDLSSHAASQPGGGEQAVLMHALQEMNDKLAATVTQLRAGSEDLVRGAGAIASTNAKLGAQCERQLAALRQAGGALGQMNEALRQNARQALDAGTLAVASRDAADGGAALLAELRAAIATAQEANRGLAAMTRGFDDIAYHANMLALSCAVEAARAGEHGGGMSMVAFDVRLLAQRTMEAARDLRELSEQAAGGADAGAELAGRAHAALAGVAGGVQQVARQVADVAAASAMHETKLDAAGAALAGLERSAEETGAMIGHTATAAATLRDRAGALLRVLGMFRLTRRPLRSGGHMYLAASNPDLIVKPARERRGRTQIAAVKP